MRYCQESEENASDFEKKSENMTITTFSIDVFEIQKQTHIYELY